MKPASNEVYQQRINAVIDHINKHLDQPHSLEDLATISQFSKFHFHRVFKNFVGETVLTFVKRLRLERAISLMRRGDGRTLTHIGLDCGFDSSSDFSRSFRQWFGFSPREFSEERLRENSKICQELAANIYYPLRNQDTSSNPDEFDVQLDQHSASNLAYVRVFGAFSPERVLNGLNQLLDWGRSKGVYSSSRLLSMSYDDMDTTPVDKYRLDWCLRIADDVAGEGAVATRRFDGGLYASVLCEGDIKLLDRAWQWLYRNWLPDSGYEPDDRPAMEWYITDPTESGWENFSMRCCIPIRSLQLVRQRI
ncbi:MAG: AraC family transcriptional regulator [Planctomycetales bacterium]|nr:AraC family transcriptional regulator [Planctomycetales bacterium]MCA9195585.1 AraC family transcriptional regulator [Planctomycetales bacterium]